MRVGHHSVTSILRKEGELETERIRPCEGRHWNYAATSQGMQGFPVNTKSPNRKARRMLPSCLQRERGPVDTFQTLSSQTVKDKLLLFYVTLFVGLRYSRPGSQYVCTP